MELFKSMSDTLTVEFTSANPEKTLEAIASSQISISHVVQHQELTYQIHIHRRDYRNLVKILRKQNTRLQIIHRRGLYWSFRKIFQQPVLVSTLLLMLILSIYLPSRILFIDVDGNQTIPKQQILSAAEACGIQLGASRKFVRSEKIKNALLSAVPQLQWAGINTSGCTAIISVRERTEENVQDKNIVSNLVADQDGYILSTTTTGGTPLVFPGDAVTKGQILISGYTDCGLCIRASRAEGEILAQTSHKLRAVIPENYDIPQITGKSHYKISLLLRKKRINLWKDSRISDTSCGRMYEEYYVSLPGGFLLPVAICIDQYVNYNLLNAAVTVTEAQHQLQKYSEDYLMQQMVSGQIIHPQYQLTHFDSLYCLESSYVCTEMIGKERREEIGVMNGKRY